jgi:hypothetical protein
MSPATSRPAAFALGITLTLAAAAFGQRYDGAGSTVQGDILRGEGQFLRGAAWYELNSAKAFERNAKTLIEMEKWNLQVYKDYQRDLSAQQQARRNLNKAQAEAARKKYEERENRLRTHPTSDDIIKGDALNALLIDLSDPSISPSAWRLVQVPLPPGLAIPALVFRFAPKPGAKSSQSLGKGVIALARLDTIKGNPWSTVLSMDELERERKAYEAAYVKVRDQCLAGKLSLDAPIGLKKAIDSLKTKVGKVVPTENGYRAVASRDVVSLGDAAQIFQAETIDYAREMIADTQNHEAKTVGELLAFMRKYRLMFASVEKELGGAEMYSQLYALMQEQKEKLTSGIEGRVEVERKSDVPKKQGTVSTRQQVRETALEAAEVLRVLHLPRGQGGRPGFLSAHAHLVLDPSKPQDGQITLEKALEQLEEAVSAIAKIGPSDQEVRLFYQSADAIISIMGNCAKNPPDNIKNTPAIAKEIQSKILGMKTSFNRIPELRDPR